MNNGQVAESILYCTDAMQTLQSKKHNIDWMERRSLKIWLYLLLVHHLITSIIRGICYANKVQSGKHHNTVSIFVDLLEIGVSLSMIARWRRLYFSTLLTRTMMIFLERTGNWNYWGYQTTVSTHIGNSGSDGTYLEQGTARQQCVVTHEAYLNYFYSLWWLPQIGRSRRFFSRWKEEERI